MAEIGTRSMYRRPAEPLVSWRDEIGGRIQPGWWRGAGALPTEPWRGRQPDAMTPVLPREAPARTAEMPKSKATGSGGDAPARDETQMDIITDLLQQFEIPVSDCLSSAAPDTPEAPGADPSASPDPQ